MAAPRYLKLGQNLKRLLFEKNMKPIDLAREVNLPQPTVHRLVTGKSTRPYKSSLKPIADFFSVTVEDLLGETSNLDRLWSNGKNDTTINSDVVKKIPIIPWEQLSTLNSARKKTHKQIVTLGQLNQATFAVIMPDSSMEPFFAEESILIFDPAQNPKDRSYVIAKLEDENIYLFRQLLIDGKDQYLKPLNPDLSLFKMRLLSNKDKLIGTLIESRNQYLSND